jgi:voltage-gated potassium channel
MSVRHQLAAVKQRAQIWEDYSANFGIVAGVLFIVSYSAEVLGTGSVAEFGTISSDVIWAYFALDLLVLFIASSSIGEFVRNNFLAILSTALPFLRAFRMLRLVLAIRAMHHITTSKVSSTAVILICALPLVWYLGAIAVLDFETASGTESPIRTFDDALWWSVSTLTTVGYGDMYPITFGGRAVAAFLMVMGVGLFSAAAGLIAGWVLKENPKLTETDESS